MLYGRFLPRTPTGRRRAFSWTAGLRIAAGLVAGIIASGHAGAQEIPLASVFLVAQSVKLQAEQVRDVALFERLEKILGRKVLGQRFPLATGSGFLIGRGLGVTAFHVVRPLGSVEKNDYAMTSFTNFLAKHLIPGHLTQSEINRVLQEFARAVKSAGTEVAIRFADGEEIAAPVVEKSADLDLALLQVDTTTPGTPIVVSPDVVLNVGDPVVAVGYPLQLVLERFLSDFKPTATSGIVSALRDDKWDIQHTAAINPGNSGGPLLTKDGRLAGINLGTVRNANQLYFALSGRRLLDWLRQTGRKIIGP